MKSWLSCGKGFASEFTEQSISDNKRIAKSEGLRHNVSLSSDKRKKSDWKRDDFLSTFSVEDNKRRVPSPDNQVIHWSESSSDDEEKAKVKTEPEVDDVDLIHQGSCQIKRRIHHRRKKPVEKKRNLCDISLSKKVLFMESLKKEQGSCSRETEFPIKNADKFRLLENSHTALPSKRPFSEDEHREDDSGSEGKSVQSENDRINKKLGTHSAGSTGARKLNQWTSSSFDFHSSVYSISTKKMKKDPKRQRIVFPDERLREDGTTESPPPEIEDCVSSCSDADSVDDLKLDDIDDGDDDKGVEELKQTDRHVEKEMRSHAVFECLKQRPLETDGKNSSMLQVFYTKGAKCYKQAPEINDPESQSIIMNESPMSQESQLNISGLSSSDSGKTSQKIGASHWASVFQREVSPPREDQTAPVNEDSGKKKRKYVSDSKSLSGQLARLVSREKSAVRFWDHALNAGSLEGKPKKYLTVRIESISRQFTFSVCECDILEGQSVSPFTTCKVVVSRSSAVKIGLKTGMVLQILPPWQQLDDGKNVTLLCTNYMQVLKDTDFTAAASPAHPSPSSSLSHIPHASSSKGMPVLLSHEESKKGSTERHLHLRWSCPCSKRFIDALKQSLLTADFLKRSLDVLFLSSEKLAAMYYDKSISISSCPATKPDFTLLTHAPQALLLSPQTVMLHSITSSAPLLSSSGCHQNTLLESIEKAHQNGNCLPPFVCVLLRVFRLKNDDSSNISLVLLVEDASGTLAVVYHCKEQSNVAMKDSVFASLVKKEGRQCLCGGVQVQQRVSKEKDPSLFSVISQCWLQRKPVVASQDDLDQDHPVWQIKVPSFCYVLQPSASDLPRIKLRHDLEEPVKFDLIQLEQMAQAGSSQRFSSVVVLLNLEVISESNTHRRFVAFDPHPSSEFTSSYRLNISEDCMNIFWSRTKPWTSLCLLKDVMLKNGILQCDKYSSLIAQSFWDTLGINEKLDTDVIQSAHSCSLRLPPLTCSANPGDIISLSGLISSVDEESSYSWQACDKCGSEITQSSKHTRIFCASCHQPVEEPVAKMKMTVLLDVEHFSKDIAVKMSLNATTIQLVLPDEEDEEGYDVEQVMGKIVKAAACIVHRCTPTEIYLEQLDL